MELPNPVAGFLEPLEELAQPYCVTGSVAAGIYGEPRMTRDIDLILLLSATALPRFRKIFREEEFYVPPLETLTVEISRTQRGSFNLIHHLTGFKADIYLAGRDSLHAWALQNRRRSKIGESALWLAPPEYVIIRKLEFLREGKQEKHQRDIAMMLACTDVDRAFIGAEASRLGLLEEWAACQAAAE